MNQPIVHDRWRPSIFLRVSFWVHVIVMLLVPLGFWQQGISLLLFNHLLLMLLGLWPRSTWLGANICRLSNIPDYVALTLDDGPDPVITPQVLDLLDQYDAKVSFFCIGSQAQKYPEIVAEIVARGHRIENHSMRHWHNFSVLGPMSMLKELRSSQAILTQLSGKRPQYFRAPAGLRNLFLDWVLRKLNLKLVSWTRRGFDARDTDSARVLNRMLKNLEPGDILLLHDRHSAISTSGIPIVLEVLPGLLKELGVRQLKCCHLPEVDA